MSQADYTIADQDGASFLVDINEQIAAIVSNNSGATEPSTTYAYMLWADTSSGILKQRNAANNAWITIGTLASTNLGLLALTGGTLTGDLSFSGTGRRIIGDFSNATIANRLMFQTSTVNAATNIHAIPNGTGNISGFKAETDPALTTGNTGSIDIIGGNDFRISSAIRGAGTYLPMTFHTGGSERMRIDTSGNVLVTNAAGLGYGTGAGGTVTQATSKSTAVTLNKPTGQITMNNAALAAGATVNFDVTNSLFNTDGQSKDVVIVNCYNNGNYRVEVRTTFGSAFRISVTNISGGSLSEALVLNFAIIKGATA